MTYTDYTDDSITHCHYTTEVFTFVHRPLLQAQGSECHYYYFAVAY
jgi:hypothetical protein